jgi:hypothetical protein
MAKENLALKLIIQCFKTIIEHTFVSVRIKMIDTFHYAFFIKSIPNPQWNTHARGRLEEVTGEVSERAKGEDRNFPRPL